MSEPRSDAEWTDFYGERRGLYRAFVERLEHFVRSLLEDEGIWPELVFSWTMDESELRRVLGRARREGRPFDSPLDGAAGVAGVSVTLASAEQLAEAIDAIDRELAVDRAESRSLDDLAEQSGSNYPYASLAVALDRRRAQLSEWAPYASLRATIEVKTVLQSGWERIDTALPFFWSESYPPEVADLLVDSVAALKRVDEDVVEARAALGRLFEEYEQAVEEGDLDLPLNPVSVAAYLGRAESIRSLVLLGGDVGLRVDEEYQPSWVALEQGVFWLVREEIGTLGELDAFLERLHPRAEQILSDILRIAEESEFTPWALSDSIVEWLWLVDSMADAETVALLEYADALTDALNTLIGNP